MASIRRKQAAKRLRAALNKRYEPQANTVQAGPVGTNQIYANGQIYNGNISGVADVVNVGRPAAANYVAKTGGGSTTVVLSGGSGGGGGGSGLPTDGTGVMSGDLNMGGNDVVNVGLVDTVDVLSLYNSYTTHNHDADYVNVTGDNMTGALTISGNTVWHAGNDGAGSGLDADLWDGNQFATYLDQPVLTTSGVTFNSVTTPSLIATSGLSITAGGDITFDPAGDDIFLSSANRIGTSNFVSGTTGWRIDYDGTADLRAIFADSLTVETFISDVNLALAGSEIIVKSLGIVADNFVVPTTSDTLTIYDLPGLNDAQNFEVGDWVRLRFVEKGTGLVVGDAWGTVGSYSDLADGEQSWTWTRQSGTTGKTINAGMVALDYGQSGDGYIHMTTLQDDSPYIDVATWVTDPSVPGNHTTHVRLGNLDGISDADLSPSGWGLFADNVALKGALVAGGGDVRADDNGITVKAGTSATAWGSYVDKLTFATDPSSPSDALTVAQMYGFKHTSSSPTFNRLLLETKAGAAFNADSASVRFAALDDNNQQAQVIAEVDTDSGSSFVIVRARDNLDNDDEFRIEAQAVFYNHMQPFAAGVYDIGTAGKPFRKLYADELIVNSTSGNGDTQTGDIWQHDATDMYIRSSSASARTLYVANPSTGTMHLDVEGDITVGGTVDGVDVSALSSQLGSHNHNDLYYTEAESDARYVRGVSGGTAISVTGDLSGYTVDHANTSGIGPSTNSVPQPLVLSSWTIDDYGHLTNVQYSNLDDRYYTETEADAAFSPLSHNHNTLYYTKAEADALFAGSGDAPNNVTGDFTVSGTIHAGLLDITSAVAGPPFTLSAQTQGETVVGLKADTLNKSVTASTGLSGGGALTSNVSVAVDQSYAFDFTGTPQFSPGSAGAPFTLGANALNQLVTGLNADKVDGIDGTSFVQIASPASITAQHTFAPTSGQAPFTLGPNAQGNVVTGLNADQLDGYQATAFARLAVANTFTEAQTIQNTNPSLYFDNTSVIWAIEPSTGELRFTLDSVEKFAISSTGGIDISGDFIVDTDTLYVDVTHDAVWINSGSPDGSASLKVSSLATDDIAAIFRAESGQIANILEIHDNSNNALVGIDASGNIESLSTAFVSGVSGWQITPDGSMEVNNLRARGEIRTALFVKDEISVNTGSHLFAEAGRTRSAFTATTGSLSLDIEDSPTEHAPVFSVGDNLLIRTASSNITGGIAGSSALHSMPLWFLPGGAPASSPSTGGLVAAQTWLQVSAVTDMTTYYRYTVTVMGGSYAVYPENTTVVSYGQGSTGIIGVFADQDYGPYLDVFIPSATPWSTSSALPLRLGRLDGVGLPELDAEQYGILIATDATDVNTARIIASNTQFSITNVPLTMTFSGESTPTFEVTDSTLKLGDLEYSPLGEANTYIGRNRDSTITLTPSVVSTSPDAFYLDGSFVFDSKYDPVILGYYGDVQMNVPMLLKYDANRNGGVYGGTGTMDTPITGIRWQANSDGTSSIDGYVDSSQMWKIASSGTWHMYDGASVRMYSIDQAYLDDPDPNGILWQRDGTATGRVYGYSDLSSNYTAVTAEYSSTGAAFARIRAYDPGSITSLGAEIRVVASSSSEYVTINRDTQFQETITIEPQSSTPSAPTTGAKIWVESSSGDLKIIWSDSTVKTIIAK